MIDTVNWYEWKNFFEILRWTREKKSDCRHFRRNETENEQKKTIHLRVSTPTIFIFDIPSFSNFLFLSLFTRVVKK